MLSFTPETRANHEHFALSSRNMLAPRGNPGSGSRRSRRIREGLAGDIIGGKQVRKPKQPSQIYDHHAVNFEYPGGMRIASQCRQFSGGGDRVDEEFRGTKGSVKIGEITDHSGKVLWQFEDKAENAYQVEHDELHEAIRNDKPLNNTVYGTTSSFSAVLGRLATYSGKRRKYADALELDYQAMPENLAWNASPPVLPDADNEYPPPMPATFKVTSVAKPPVT